MSVRKLPPRGPWHHRRPWSRAAQVLGRDLVVGAALWGSRSTHLPLDLAAGLACLLLAVLASRWFGLSTRWSGFAQPQPWAVACKEGALIFIGGACIANLLRLSLGMAPWFGQAAG